MHQVTSIVGIFLVLAASGQANNTFLYFDQSGDCDKQYDVGEDAVITAEAQKIKGTVTTPFSTCEMKFRAPTNQRICLTIRTMIFSSQHLHFNIFDAQDSLGTPVKTYKMGDVQKVREICSTSRYMVIQVADNSTGNLGRISDLNLTVQVVNMQGNQRTSYLDTDCATTRTLDNSRISVVNRQATVTGTLPALCQTTFVYDGNNSSRKMCLRYQRTSIAPCGYSLLVKEGNTSSSRTLVTYNCDNIKPEGTWCVGDKSLVLELQRTNTDTANEGEFMSILVKDGEAPNIPVTTPGPTPNPGPFRLTTGVIVGIAIGAIVLVIIVITTVVCCVKKTKGHHSVPQDDHDADKL